MIDGGGDADEVLAEPTPTGRGGTREMVRRGWEALDPSQRFLLWVLAATSFFDGYDRGIQTVALKQIRGTFGLTESSASIYLGAMYLGAIPALFLTRRADRVGRRRLLMYSIVGYTLATGLSAATPNVGYYTAAQFVAKVFLNAEAAIVWTMVAEELPARARGFGFGILAMASALGTGLGAIVFGVAFDPHGISWRWLYVIGLPPLFLVGWLRRSIPESRRFETARDERRLARRWQQILEPPHRRWLVLVVVTALLTELTVQAGTFTIDYMQTARHLGTGTADLMLVFAGLPGIPIMVAAGSLSDHYGRRLVGCAFAGIGTLGALGFFWLPGGVPVLLPCLTVALVGQLGAWPTLGAYASELFPTALRGQAGSWANLARLIGDVASFWLGALLLHATGQDFPITVTILGIGPVIAVVLFAVAFPDTHGRELEDIAPD